MVERGEGRLAFAMAPVSSPSRSFYRLDLEKIRQGVVRMNEVAVQLKGAEVRRRAVIFPNIIICPIQNWSKSLTKAF